MFQQIFAIIRNTFFESIRQPIMLVVLVVATIALILSNPLAAFTMSDDQRMFIDLGLATVFLCGCLLAAFIATNVLGREIENRTALTVISKPVPRVLFVIGKYLGVAAAISLGTLYMAVVFMLADLHSVLQTVRDPLHGPVLVFSGLAGFIGVAVAVWCNYFYGKAFASTAIAVTTPLAAIAYLLSMMFQPDFSTQAISLGFKPQLWLALIALWMAIMVLTAIALAASTRFGQVMTLMITVAVFLLGMLSDWMFSRPLAGLEHTWAQRTKHMTSNDVEQRLDADHLEDLRDWTLEALTQQADRRYLTWRADYLKDTGKERLKLRSLSEAERSATLAAMESDARRQAAERLAAERAEATRVAESLRWPPPGSELVRELDWPLVVERSDSEAETISTTRTLVYPPARWAVAFGSERMTYLAYRLATVIVPNFQVMFLSDALTQGHLIPMSYVLSILVYGVLYIGAALALAVVLFQTREVG